MKSFPNRPKFSCVGALPNGAPTKIDVSTADLIHQALVYSSPQMGGGLSVQDVLMLNDILPRVEKAGDSIVLENAEMEHLQKKVEACRWNVWAPEVAVFIRDVRGAEGVGESPSTPRRSRE